MASKSLVTVQHTWETWDIRILMVTSLSIQVLLIFLAPLRKRWANGFFKFSMWFLYLVADAVALYTIGLISHRQGDTPPGTSQKPNLFAFWAPFLLLHLGGPDTITALALEDNELWHRHALLFVTQVIVTVYVFFRSYHSNHLRWLTVFMFFNGCIKYMERTSALYFASMENFGESQRSNPEAGPNYARLMEQYSSAVAAHIPTVFKGKDSPSNRKSKFQGRGRQNSSVNEQSNMSAGTGTDEPATSNEDTQQLLNAEETMVQDAYNFYEKFKVLLADSILSLKDRDESRAFFLEKPAQDAFGITQIELHFIYDIFYTKVMLLHRKRSYARPFCYPLVLASLLLFYRKDKSAYENIDIRITFALLWGAITLDMFATLMFLLSDWCIIVISRVDWPKRLASCILWLRRMSKSWRGPRCSCWSQSISQYNLLTRCLSGTVWYEKIHIKKIRDIFIATFLVDRKKVEEDLINFIVEELQKKARLATDTETTKEVCSARGTLVSEADCFLISECLRPWTVDIDYDESLLIWHLATDLCYQTSGDPDRDNEYCKFSKILSDYMSYLLLTQQALVSPVIGASDIRFLDTREEVKKFIQNSWMLQTSPLNENKFCEKVLEVKAEVQPIEAKGDKSKSVLFDACRLAKQLKMFKKAQWEIMSKVWVELLSYAAIRCTPRSHVAQLSRGGELITTVWLLMAHLGLGERFRQNQGFGLTKLVIYK